ncbi:hypothetical protein ARALYDRAFT_314242 [Arabidopsis lyrata subsp. lyrata]|uniref:Adenosylmethionine decarboxylase n=1 Tax=Arabidopsis lyrata subsp. lyrata TaxID=81972 RepID=D7KC12_ARALL|nr:hypothetical protein ARALYDRAFT_314242 [Arabidopsis lyrata subsp. lyrata]
MASAFEGVEKRLEIIFSASTSNKNLREKLTRNVLHQILKPVDCKIEDLLSEDQVDAYLLSASSLFVFDDFVILKTCGNTKIFECMKELIRVAAREVNSVLYTRGQFFWPQMQPDPHSFFIRLIPISQKQWHILSDFPHAADNNTKEVLTVELCMRRLDREKASIFEEKTSPTSEKMTEASGIGLIFPEAKLSTFAFSPCGYSMNSVEGKAISTIHVVPEEAWSFASFECCGYEFKDDESLQQVVARALACFKPKMFTLAIRSNLPVIGGEPQCNLDPDGYSCKREICSLEKGGSVVYYYTV